MYETLRDLNPRRTGQRRFVLLPLLLSLLLGLLLSACGGNDSAAPPVVVTPGSPPPPPPPGPTNECVGQCADTPTSLASMEVEQILSQAIAEANARQAPATIAVVDRVGNVLAVYRMTGAPTSVTITSNRGVVGGLEGIEIIPAELAAIAKAVTGAYLSSEGNAFSTRTASQIVQEHFNPGELNAPSGPLFGVQFSQLPCSDVSARFAGNATGPGPHRSPLGLSADPGGLPLYKNGTPVGGIGVAADGIYGLDPAISDTDADVDEQIALAGMFGYFPHNSRRGDQITVEGKTFRFSDAQTGDLLTDPANAPALAQQAGQLLAVTGYTNGNIRAGTAFGQPASGIRPDLFDFPNQDAFVLVDSSNMERFRPQAGSETDGSALTQEETRTILSQALAVANRARAQIRAPLNSQARVSIAVTDTNGLILGLVRTRDAPIFGTDVAVQKSRTAAFFSNPNAAADLQMADDAVYLGADGSPSGEVISIGDYVSAAGSFLDDPQVLTGQFAFSDRAGGNLSRPYFPDGIIGSNHGPFSKAFERWSPFSVGLQLDLVYNQIITHVVNVLTAGSQPDVAQNCSGLPRLANGLQIFPGSVPIYRGSQLVGGIGVSGDGVDQDDMISFLGVHNAAQVLGSINNAPSEIRADTLTPQGVRLRYIQCPFRPFIDSDETNVCQGK